MIELLIGLRKVMNRVNHERAIVNAYVDELRRDAGHDLTDLHPQLNDEFLRTLRIVRSKILNLINCTDRDICNRAVGIIRTLLKTINLGMLQRERIVGWSLELPEQGTKPINQHEALVELFQSIKLRSVVQTPKPTSEPNAEAAKAPEETASDDITEIFEGLRGILSEAEWNQVRDHSGDAPTEDVPTGDVSKNDYKHDTISLYDAITILTKKLDEIQIEEVEEVVDAHPASGHTETTQEQHLESTTGQNPPKPKHPKPPLKQKQPPDTSLPAILEEPITQQEKQSRLDDVGVISEHMYKGFEKSKYCDMLLENTNRLPRERFNEIASDAISEIASSWKRAETYKKRTIIFLVLSIMLSSPTIIVPVLTKFGIISFASNWISNFSNGYLLGSISGGVAMILIITTLVLNGYRIVAKRELARIANRDYNGEYRQKLDEQQKKIAVSRQNGDAIERLNNFGENEHSKTISDPLVPDLP
jgi:hypothetical protein